MRAPKIAVGLRACGVALALGLAAVCGAEIKPPVIGATRAQVLERYGEPVSTIVAGNREVLFFAHDRIVLRDGVVVEAEPIMAEAPARPPAPVAPPPAAATPAADTAAAGNATPPAAQPAATPSATPSAANPASASTAAPRAGADSATPAATTPPPPAPEPQLSIKSVRPPTGVYVRPPPKQESATPAPATATPPATATAMRPVASKATTPAAATTRPRPVPPPSVAAPKSASTVANDMATKPAVEATDDATKPEVAPAAPPTEEKKKKARAMWFRRKQADAALDLDETDATYFSPSTYLIAFFTIAGCGGYLFWRYRQRQLELAASAVSNTPFSAAGATATSARFTAELLGQLEWKRFEELVASYYGKTGVVAVRTKTGPASPVHIKISWKGEARPFACVQCIAQAGGLIDVKPLQDLFAVLTAEDIRRGYVVTTAKFNVAARDFAEEKHFTLLPGDLFLEKLNALPDAARAELMHEVTAGDYTTPSCPKCEAKMVHSPEDPTLWQCPTHKDQTMPVR